MLKLSDSRNFGRTFAGLSLIVSSILFLVGTALDPAWADDSVEYLDEVAADKGLYALSGILSLVGALLLIPGLLGVIHLLRSRRVTLGQIGAGLVIIGAVAIAGSYVINVFEILATDEQYDRAQMAELFDDTEESAEAIPFFVMFVCGLVLGSILLAIGLWRQRAVPVWIPILLVLGNLAAFVGGEGQAAGLISSVILAAALIPLGLRILSVSDDDWERWEVLPAGERQQVPAAERPEAPPGTS
jgi:drug/metabolite transporter (DMT)-like permease